jgi:glutathione S-transferase
MDQRSLPLAGAILKIGFTMKLYYSPASCAMSPHIVLAELGIPYKIERVDLATKTTESGTDLHTINDQGAVPVLELDTGETLTEGAAIVQYLADQKPSAGLLPAAGTLERARVQEWLNYIATEMHKAHVPLFKSTSSEEAKEAARQSIFRAYDHVTKKLGSRQFLVDDAFTVADAYMFTILNWSSFIQVSLKGWPVLEAYQKRIGSRAGVQLAMKEEGLV